MQAEHPLNVYGPLEVHGVPSAVPKKPAAPDPPTANAGT
eukprot:COSAG02_NODE_41622_length_392_cov_1.392491_1_plen_38_part_01